MALSLGHGAAVFDNGADFFIDQHSEHGDAHALDDIDRSDHKDHECRQVFDSRIDRFSHLQDGLHGHPEEFRECREQVDRIEPGAEHRHDDRTRHTADDGVAA